MATVRELVMRTPDRPDKALQSVSTGRLCAGCGQRFAPARTNQRHCRPSCRLAAFKRRREKLVAPNFSSDGDQLAGLFE